MNTIRILLTACVVALAGATTASAATIEVTTTKDEFGAGPKKCSLREAIQAANTNAKFGGCPKGKGADRVVLGKGTYRLTRVGSEPDNESGDLNIGGSITIAGKGPRATVVDGNGGELREGIFEVTAGRAKFAAMTIRRGWDADDYSGGAIDHTSPGNLVLDRVRIVGNFALSGGGVYHSNNASDVKITRSAFLGNEAENYGGGFYTAAVDDVTVRNSTFRDNEADYGYGGGLGITGGAGQTVIARSTFAANVSDYQYGGGLFIAVSGGARLTKSSVMDNVSGAYGEGYGGGIYANDTDLVVRDSTVSRNVADGDGGGIEANGGSLTVINSTISHNHASYSGGYGGGIYSYGDTEILSSTVAFNRGYHGAGLYRSSGGLTYKNSIIAGNRRLYNEWTRDCEGLEPDASLGHNFLGDDTCDSDGPGDIATGTYETPADPMLDALDDYGGPTPTHALLRGSPAIDKGKGCPKRDQRGRKRKGKCDIGAFER